ncbi:MAG: hypothetical protein QXG00_06365 [Candidatus Woesearchaeota archaeon]
MELKVDYNCDICNEQKTCFIFKEFNAIFSICNECFYILNEKAPTLINDICFLCDITKETLFELERKNQTPIRKLKICIDCKDKLEKLIGSTKI